jgi:cysteine-rich repeat protein
MTVQGIGVATITEPSVHVGHVLHDHTVFLWPAFAGGWLDATNPAIPTLYGLDTPLGPVVGDAAPNVSQFMNVASDLGAINLTSSSPVTFQAFTACGNGMIDAGEQCDDGNVANHDCCSSTCQFEPVNTTCAHDLRACTLDVCDGAGLCTHPAGNAGVTCRPAATVCDVAETCTGLSIECPPDAQAPNGQPCAEDGNVCTVGGTCQGGTCVGSTALDCDDGDPCTIDSCTSLVGCAHDAAVRINCLNAGKSFLLLRNKTDDNKDKLVWKWSKGAALSLADLADPSGGTRYGLCVYTGLSGTFVAGAVLPPGAGWSPIGTKGFSFSGTSPNGLTKALLKSGTAGKSKALIKGRGVALPDPALPLSLEIIVQLVKDGSPLCLQSVFSEAVRNDATRFKAKTP